MPWLSLIHILAADGLLTMNAFEPLFWMGCAYLLIRLIKTENEKLWIWFGVVAGFGLENKYSMLIFGAGLVLGLLLTPARRLLKSRWLWAGGAIAFLIFLPNLIWNLQHHFPFLELQANIRASGRDVRLGPLAFFVQEILLMHPLTPVSYTHLNAAGRDGSGAVGIVLGAGANIPGARDHGDKAIVGMEVGMAHVVRMPLGQHNVEARLGGIAGDYRLAGAAGVIGPVDLVGQGESEDLRVGRGGVDRNESCLLYTSRCV